MGQNRPAPAVSAGRHRDAARGERRPNISARPAQQAVAAVRGAAGRERGQRSPTSRCRTPTRHIRISGHGEPAARRAVALGRPASRPVRPARPERGHRQCGAPGGISGGLAWRSSVGAPTPDAGQWSLRPTNTDIPRHCETWRALLSHHRQRS